MEESVTSINLPSMVRKSEIREYLENLLDKYESRLRVIDDFLAGDSRAIRDSLITAITQNGVFGESDTPERFKHFISGLSREQGDEFIDCLLEYCAYELRIYINHVHIMLGSMEDMKS